MKLKELGSEIKYNDANGNTATGIIHSVQKREDSNGRVLEVSYQIDTGADLSVEEYKSDVRDVELKKRINKEVRALKKTPTQEDINAIAERHAQAKDLPKSEIVVEKVRQPKLVTVPAEAVVKA